MMTAKIEKNKEYLENEDKWDFAMGLASIDGATAPEYFLDLVEREKRGEITTNDIRAELNKRYGALGTVRQ